MYARVRGGLGDRRASSAAPSWRRTRHAPRPSASRNGQTLTTDGPFAETKESIGGYYLFEADEPRRRDRLRRADPRGRLTARSRFARSWSADLATARPKRSSARSGAARSRSWPASSATSTSPRMRCRTRSRSPSSAGRATATPRNPGAWIVDHRTQPGDRPDPPRAHAAREDRAAGTPRSSPQAVRRRTRWTPRSPTSGSG